MTNNRLQEQAFDVDIKELRSAIQFENEAVALKPELGFHFHPAAS